MEIDDALNAGQSLEPVREIQRCAAAEYKSAAPAATRVTLRMSPVTPSLVCALLGCIQSDELSSHAVDVGSIQNSQSLCSR